LSCARSTWRDPIGRTRSTSRRGTTRGRLTHAQNASSEQSPFSAVFKRGIRLWFLSSRRRNAALAGMSTAMRNPLPPQPPPPPTSQKQTTVKGWRRGGKTRGRGEFSGRCGNQIVRRGRACQPHGLSCRTGFGQTNGNSSITMRLGRKVAESSASVETSTRRKYSQKRT